MIGSPSGDTRPNSLGLALLLIFLAMSRPMIGPTRGAGGTAGATCPHRIEEAKCPFCHPERIEKLGKCVEHDGVPEALCTRCRAFLIPAFLARKDWCVEHSLPESQCRICHPEGWSPPASVHASDPSTVPPSGTTSRACPHQIEEATCPFCHPERIEKLGKCVEHDGVPEALCTRCREYLVPAFKTRKDWCAEHGLPESQCRVCHPDGWTVPGNTQEPEAATPIEGASSTEAALCPHRIEEATCPFCHPERIEKLGPCGEHGVPEALCTRCRRDLIPAFKTRKDWCEEHGLPESQCVICGADPRVGTSADGDQGALPRDSRLELGVIRLDQPSSTTCDSESQRVVIKSADAAARAGFMVEPIREAEVAESLGVPARTALDANRTAHLAPRLEGLVTVVHVDVGDEVETGTVLAEITAPSLGEAKATLLEAQATFELRRRIHDRQQSLAEKRVATEKDLLESEIALETARIRVQAARSRLSALGLVEAEVDQVLRTRDTGPLLTLTAPFPGMITARHAVIGERANPGSPLFTLTDIGQIWAILDVFEADITRIRTEQPVTLEVGAKDPQHFDGRISWVSPVLDEHTRTLPVRAVFPDPDHRLKANLYAKALIEISPPRPRLLVSRRAVQWDGCCNLVFLADSPTTFVPRKVELGAAIGDDLLVEAGLSGGEQVVTTGSFLLKTEIRKDAIGAGCCEAPDAAE